MVRWRFAGVLLLSIFMASAQVSPQDQRADKSKLIALENAWNQAQMQNDGEALNRLIADTYVYTDWDGTVMDKARFIASNNDPDVHATLLVNDGVDVHFYYPGVAVVTGAYHFKGTNKGKPFDRYGRFTDTWISSAGQWVCVASHASLVRKSASH